ncbi:MAG: ABC transporter substrate-binding protein [Proteobacteria bacterium]|nr:ABC transporter substrate-binding protein [Pseudomonadota bacterium]
MRRMLAILALGLGLMAPAVVLAAETKPIAVKYAYQPTAPIATFIAATGIGAFEKEGLKVEVENGTEPAVMMQMIQAGQAQLTGSGIPSLLQVSSVGAKLRAVATLEYTFTDDDGFSAEAVFLVAPQDRGIKTLADLKGRRLAISSYSTAWSHALTSHLIERNINPKDVTYLVVPFPQMPGALLTREVDAAIITSTEYVRTAQRTPVEVLMSGTQLTRMKLDLTQAIVGRDDWLRQNEDTVVRFIKALYRARQFMQQDNAETGGRKVRQMIQAQTKFDESLSETYYKYRAAYVGRELKHTNPLDIPKSTVVRYRDTMADAKLLTGKAPLEYDTLVDHRYLKRALAELGVAWDPTKVEP